MNRKRAYLLLTARTLCVQNGIVGKFGTLQDVDKKFLRTALRNNYKGPGARTSGGNLGWRQASLYIRLKQT